VHEERGQERPGGGSGEAGGRQEQEVQQKLEQEELEHPEEE
jgi:hypothetical protein